jgi:hypothetical protein
VRRNIFLLSTQDSVQWSASRPDRFAQGKKPLDRTLGGPQSPFGRSAKETILLKMRVFSAKTQLHYLTNQLDVSTTVSSHHQTEPKNIKGNK